MRSAARLAAAFLLLAPAGFAAHAQGDLPGTVRDVTPPGVTPGPALNGPLVREPAPPRKPDPPRWRRFFLPQTSDAATFSVESRTIRISGVTPPQRDEECRKSDGTAWPCGRSALHALRMFLGGRAIECYFPPVGTEVEVVAPCRVGSTDIGLWLLSQGWGKPDTYATDPYRQAAETARCTGKGLWRGIPPEPDCAGPMAH